MNLIWFIIGVNAGRAGQQGPHPDPVPMTDAQAAFFVCAFITGVVLVGWAFWNDWMEHRRIARRQAEVEAEYQRRYAEWERHRSGMPPCPPSSEYVSF